MPHRDKLCLHLVRIMSHSRTYTQTSVPCFCTLVTILPCTSLPHKIQPYCHSIKGLPHFFFILCTDQHTSKLYACHHTSRLSTQDTTLPHTVHKPPHLHTSAVQQKIDGSSHLQVLRVISGPAASVSPPLSYNLFLCRSTAAAVPNSRLCL